MSGVKTPCLISSTCWPYILFFSSSCFLSKQTDFWSGCWERWGVHCHSEGVPLSSTFSGGYLSTSLYQTADWGLIGIEQDLSQGWTHDADVVQSCLLVY